MKYVFDPEGLQALTRFARSRTLLALDFDGTLSPIVSDRESARMPAATARLLSLACERYPTAVISGRSRADLADRVAGCAVKHLVGNHGIEPASDMQRFEAEVAQMRSALGAELAEITARGDVDIEDKRYSLAIHYRNARDEREARDAILAASRRLPREPRIMFGKAVINLLPKDAPHKGTALQQLQAEENAETAIYVGDDVTDEDVFELGEPNWLLGIRVGENQTSRAEFFMREQSEIDLLLERLIALRTEGRGA